MTKEKFESYVAVQESGVTNMFDVTVVSTLSGLTRAEILDIMDNYTAYREKFLSE